MATFPSISPDYGATKQAQPRVRAIEFGSGYSQRATFGINQDPKVWTLAWNNRSATDANTIEDTTSYKWICKSWRKTMPYSNLFNIDATFEQVFET